MGAKKRATKKKRAKASSTKALRTFALSLPAAWEDYPWGERVVKVGKKVFVFMGKPLEAKFGLSVKLPKSKRQALAMDFTEPTGYGLGKSGWVSAVFTGKRSVPIDLLKQWIEESYRAVAPAHMVKELDAREA